MYSIIYTLLLFILIPYIKIRSVLKGYDFSLKERLVLYTDNIKNPLWFHCASVGELNTLRPVYNFYKNKYKILITVSSPRAKKYAAENFQEAIIRELPFDFKLLIKRFLKIYSPLSLIIVEEELWKNLITTSYKHIPVISINARISPSSFKFYKIFQFFYKNIFEKFKIIIARSEFDAKLISYFVDRKKIVVCGDLKFVSSKIKKELNINIPQNKKIIIGGSTYRSEEILLLDAFNTFKESSRLILAPRHLERLNEVINLVKERGYSLGFFSEGDFNKQVIIVDKLGVLSFLYKYADAVFVGGTVENIGGHNILEALIENKPVIIGKNYFKIKSLVEEFKDYIFIIENKKDLEEAIKKSFNFKNIINIEEKIDKIYKCYINNLEKVLNESRN
jgi:3-deoxy-D-manno-octulosonic-acid transferase